MEISLAPELEARLTRIASEAGKAANQVVQELVADYLDHDEWFKREVQKGLPRWTTASLCRMRKWAGEWSAFSGLDDGSMVSRSRGRFRGDGEYIRKQNPSAG